MKTALTERDRALLKYYYMDLMQKKDAMAAWLEYVAEFGPKYLDTQNNLLRLGLISVEDAHSLMKRITETGIAVVRQSILLKNQVTIE